jgi:hypothetical protein
MRFTRDTRKFIIVLADTDHRVDDFVRFYGHEIKNVE